MIIKSSAGTEIAKNGYTVIDELNQIPMIKTNYLQLEHNHINPIIIGSKAFEYKDIFVNVVEDTETSGDTAFKEYNAIHEFAWILSGMRKHDSYTGYLSLEQYLTMVLKDTEFTYQVEGGHQYYALQFENLGDGESHLDMFFKMLNRWNTEFELRGKKVYITHQRGRLRDKHVGRYKMNIIDTIINSDITDGATAVWGYFGKKDEENPENSTYREFYWQIDELVEQYGIRYAKPYSNENITQEETMIEYLNNIILDSWKISTEVDIAEFTDEVVQTGDEYVAVDERLGITLNTRIQKLESVYDADDKLLYQTATLGTVSFASAASGSSSQLQEVIEKVKKDYNDRITDLKQEFDNRFNDEVTQIEIEFNELVNGVRQEIKADREAFELRYKADKEALSGEIQDSYTNAVTEANRIVEAKETDFKNYADGIGSAANGRIDDLYGGLGDLSSEFESLEIGGRNYALNSNKVVEYMPNARFSYDISDEIKKQPQTQFCVSFDMEYTGTENVSRVEIYLYNGKFLSYKNGASSGNRESTPIGGLKNNGDWTRYEGSLYTVDDITNNDNIKIIVRATVVGGGFSSDIRVSNMKLEKGSKATDWSPAPEDVDQKLTIIANDLDGVQTKVENNTGAITTVTQQANGLETRVTNAEGNINTVTQLATGTQQRVTDAEGNINTITNLANGTQQTVTNMLNGNATKGTVFQNTVDGFLNRVWQTDIDNLQIGGRNLLKKSNDISEYWVGSVAIISQDGDVIRGESNGKTNPSWPRLWTTAVRDIDFDLTSEYTISFWARANANASRSVGIMTSGSTKTVFNYTYSVTTEWVFYTRTFTPSQKVDADVNLQFYVGGTTGDATSWLELKYIKLEKGNKPTDWTPAPEDLMKYTDIAARPDGFLIGTFEMGGDKIAQAIVGKDGAIDLIAQNVNFTGNVNVANQIKTYSLEAVYADIAKLRTNILTANSVTSNALKVDTALIKKLNTNSILTNYLIADTAMIENIKSKSLEAVYANISELRTRLLVADVITANMVKFDTALIEKFTSSTAFINSLTAKSAFISNVKAIDIDFNRASATGGSGSATLSITGDRILQSGTFNRIWKGVSYNYNVSTIMREGYIKFADFNREREISMSAFGISTFVDGSGNDAGFAGSSGTISWWDNTYGNADGITMSSHAGVSALKSFRNRVVLEANSTVDISSEESGIVLEPNKTNFGGVNRFAFTTANSESQSAMVGYLMFGAGTSDYPYGVGLRFNKPMAHKRISVVDSNFAVASDTIFEVGRVETQRVASRPGVESLEIYSRNALLLYYTADGNWGIQSDYIYTSTYSNAPNMFISQGNVIGRSTSARKYKLAIEKQFENDIEQYEYSKRILELDIKTWFDRRESEMYAKEIEKGERISKDEFTLERHAGLIAEDVYEVGLDEHVSYGADGEIEGIAYDRLWIHLLPIVKKQNDRINELENKLNKIMEMMK